MTPELAADKAASALYLAEKAVNNDRELEKAAMLAGIAAVWVQLHTALAHAPKTAHPVTVNVEGMSIKDADPKKIAEDIAAADGRPRQAQQIGIYRERAFLIAHIAALYPSAIVYGADPENPGWPVIYITTARGQLSWHLSSDDLDLFAHVPVREGDEAPVWDGHTTSEKYWRLAGLTYEQSGYDEDQT